MYKPHGGHEEDALKETNYLTKSGELSYMMNRKRRLIELYGGKCENCGYDKNIASLSFHHEDELLSKQKQRDRKGHTIAFIATRFASEILRSGKPDKRIHLFCSNCHMEIHHPECNF